MEALLLLSNTSECDADCGWSTQWQRAFKEGFYTESACHSGDPGLIPGSARFPGKGIGYPLQCSWASPVAQLVKNLPAMWDTWVRSLGWEDPLEKGLATTPVFWPGEFHGLYSPWGGKESDMTEQLSLSKIKNFVGISIGITLNLQINFGRKTDNTEF